MFLTLSLLSAIGISLLIYKAYKYVQPNESIKDLPSINPFLYILSLFRDEPNDLRMKRLVDPVIKDNRLARLWLGRWFVLVSDYSTITDILTKEVTIKLKQNDLAKDSLASRFIGSNLVEVDGEEWKRHRKVVNSNFKRGWDTLTFGSCCLKFLTKIEKEWQDPQFNITQQLRNLTLDALGLYIFNIDFNTIQDDDNEISTTYSFIMKKLENLLLALFPWFMKMTSLYQVLAIKIDRFRYLIQQLIDTKRKQLEEGELNDDLITNMLKAKDEGGKPTLTDREIIDDTIVFFVAGHDTTAHTLTFILYYLAKHQQFQNQLREEIYSVLGIDDSKVGNEIKVPSLQQCNQMHFLMAVIYETMRINPVVTQMGRKLITEYAISNEQNQITLPRDQLVLFHIQHAMQDTNIFPNPHQFNPDRFINLHGEFDKSLAKFNLGFGYGSRICLGQSFSITEQKVVLITLLQKFKIGLPQDSKHLHSPVLKSIGIMSIRDLQLHFERI